MRHHLGVGIELRERLAVALAPAAEYKTIGEQAVGHTPAMMPTRTLRLVRSGSYGAPTRERDAELTEIHSAPRLPKGGP